MYLQNTLKHQLLLYKYNWCTMLNLLRNMYVELVCWYHQNQWKTSALSKQHFRRLRILLSNLISSNKFCLQCNFTARTLTLSDKWQRNITGIILFQRVFNSSSNSWYFDIVKFLGGIAFYFLFGGMKRFDEKMEVYMKFEGGCHCGAVKFEVVAPRRPLIMYCK